MKQLSHSDIHNSTQRFPITIVCDAIRTPENIGMCFRIAESFGVSKIYLHHQSPTIDNRIVRRTARNTVDQIPYELYTDFEILIQQFNFCDFEIIVLLFGSERYGIQDIELLDASIAIPMYGHNTSMNVVHSMAICLYEATNQLKKLAVKEMPF